MSEAFKRPLFWKGRVSGGGFPGLQGLLEAATGNPLCQEWVRQRQSLCLPDSQSGRDGTACQVCTAAQPWI